MDTNFHARAAFLSGLYAFSGSAEHNYAVSSISGRFLGVPSIVAQDEFQDTIDYRTREMTGGIDD
jgi:hypothetical protein